MLDMGIRGTYILPEPKKFCPTSVITEMKPEYLTDEFFELVRYAVLYADSIGISAWLYDVGGLPVGKGMRSCCESASRYVREKDNPTGCVLVFYESALSATLTASAHSIRFLNRSQPYS